MDTEVHFRLTYSLIDKLLPRRFKMSPASTLGLTLLFLLSCLIINMSNKLRHITVNYLTDKRPSIIFENSLRNNTILK